MKKHDFGAWFLLCALLFLFAPGVSAMAEETEPLFAFAAQEEEVRPGGSFAVTCTPARGDIGAFVLFADFDAEVIANAKAELPESVKSRHVYTSQQDGRFALVYAAKDGGALTEPFTLVFRTERGAEFDAVTVSFSGERCGARTDRYGADDGKDVHLRERAGDRRGTAFAHPADGHAFPEL